MKHLEFDSIYRPDFEVVEQRDGNRRLYPHTDQLPLLWRALNIEFRSALPNRLARVTAKSDGYNKVMLATGALMFCATINGSRKDQLRLYRVFDPDLVARISVVQQITEHDPRGACHRFRFYAGPDFFTEIYLSGKRVAFADHVLQRFSTRVPDRLGDDMATFLLTFYGSPIVGFPVGPGRAFVMPFDPSLLAFTYKESDTEYFITTCLTVKEIDSLGLDLPPVGFNHHFGPAFTKPPIRNWRPLEMALDLHKRWTNKVPLPQPRRDKGKQRWYEMAAYLNDIDARQGHGPGSRLVFQDRIHGTCILAVKPNETEMQHDELKDLEKAAPQYDWEAAIADRDAEARRRTRRIEE